MIGERWSTTIRNAAILAEPKGPTICSCGAPGGSAHNHNTGRVVTFRACSHCRAGWHNSCRHTSERCGCADRGHTYAR